MSNRRSFIKGLSVTFAGLPLSSQLTRLQSTDWSNWSDISTLYPQDTAGRLNFNCGSAGVQPTVVLESMGAHQRALSAFAPYEIYEQHKDTIDKSKLRLAELINVNKEQVALVRNTTAAINDVLYGIQWREGDEVVISTVDYPSVWNTLKTLQQRYGIGINTVRLDLNQDSEQAIVNGYRTKISNKTRLIIATHVTHREGQLMPVALISALGKGLGIDVLIDGAHAVGHIKVDVQQIGCQYYATSLHKWLSAPLGCGLLYVQKDKIASLYPPTSYAASQQELMDKFTWIGTFAFEKWMTLDTVLDFQDSIGLENKSTRLRAMSTRFREGLAGIPGLIIAGNQKDYGGITAFRVEGINNSKLHNQLMEDYGFHVKKVGIQKVLYNRASFNLHLTDSQVDDLIAAISDRV